MILNDDTNINSKLYCSASIYAQALSKYMSCIKGQKEANMCSF